MKPSSTDYKVMKTKRAFHKEAILNFKRSEMERKENTNLIDNCIREISTLEKIDYAGLGRDVRPGETNAVMDTLAAWAGVGGVQEADAGGGSESSKEVITVVPSSAAALDLLFLKHVYIIQSHCIRYASHHELCLLDPVESKFDSDSKMEVNEDQQDPENSAKIVMLKVRRYIQQKCMECMQKIFLQNVSTCSPDIIPDSGYPHSSSPRDWSPGHDIPNLGGDIIEIELPKVDMYDYLVKNGLVANNNRDDEVIDLLEIDLENENDINDVQNGFPAWLLRICAARLL
ncbi:hypothetical protein PV328_001214 [Microctonus aethiopoides]|uniref:Uncharacterized protein n=1 Tax=Microctonus aethiopoides TaxID=144406 RepID=A0AA39FWG6_9HYME|nr:hypothetical protein PV328_001214 [Microctonus aethiopoides]